MLDQKYFEEIDYSKENPISELSVSEFHECTFSGLDLTGLSFRNSIFVSCKFENCNLSAVDMFSTTLRDIEFKGCKIVGVNFSVANTLSLLNFKDSILNMSIFHGIDAKGIEFHQCSLQECDFYEAILENSKFLECNLEASVFTKSNLFKADFSYSQNYFIDPNYTNIKKAKFSMPEAMILLKAFEVEIV